MKGKKSHPPVIQEQQKPYQSDKRKILKFVPKLRKIKKGGR
jgi:hypothetical protein